MTHMFRNIVVAAVAALTVTSAAQAAVNVSASALDTPLPGDQTLIYDFDGLSAAGYDLAYAGAVGVFDGSDGLHPNVAAPPPGTLTNYLAIQQGGSATLTASEALYQLSVYIGSPDSFNSIRFIGLNGFDVTLSGAQLAAGAFNGDQSVGRRMTYNFGGDQVTQVIFSSSGYSFELDNIAVSAVPEPATWAMMIAGFGMMGAALRRRQAAPAVVRA
jgi:hypothetical protein